MMMMKRRKKRNQGYLIMITQHTSRFIQDIICRTQVSDENESILLTKSVLLFVDDDKQPSFEEYGDD